MIVRHSSYCMTVLPKLNAYVVAIVHESRVVTYVYNHLFYDPAEAVQVAQEVALQASEQMMFKIATQIMELL